MYRVLTLQFTRAMQVAQYSKPGTWARLGEFPDRNLWTGLSSASKRLVRLSLVLLLVMAVAIAGTISFMRNSAIEAATVDITKLGLTISEQTARAFQATDMVLRGLQEKVAATGITTPADFRRYFSPEVTHEELKLKGEELPQTNAFTIIDAEGSLVNFSRSWPVPTTDLSDREYFKYLRDHDDDRAFISSAVHNRGNGAMTAYLVRRVDSPNGEFLGIVLGAMDLNYFKEFYKSISSEGMSITMLRNDGAELVGHPAISEVDGKMPMSIAWHEAVGDGQGVYLSSGIFGRSSRLVSVHALASYPVVVDVGASYAQITAAWKGEAAFITVGAVCAIVCFCLLIRTLALQLHRLEASEAFLSVKNKALVVAHERLQAQATVLSDNQCCLTEKSVALEMTMQTMDQGLMTVDAEGRVTSHNRRLLEILGLPDELLATKPLYSELIAYQQATGEFDVPDQHIPLYVSSGIVPGERDRYERLRPNGRSVEVQSIPFPDGGMVRTFTDITDRRRSEEQLRYFARHDSLTKLSNRMVFHERLQQALTLADRTGQIVAVLCLDLDRFKFVNDTRGHGVGDKLLAEVSARLSSAVRDIDTVARMGGDEFALVLPMVQQPKDAEVMAARLLHTISAPYIINGIAAHIGVSIGISLYSLDGETAEGMLRDADIALYRAKADGRGVWRLFQPLMEAEKADAFQLEQDLRGALSRKELHLEYQPIIDTGTGATVAYEALMRWNHPTRGTIGPSAFIPLAELSDSIIPMGLWALEAACEQAASWRDGVRISVNLSPMQFRQGDLVEQVDRVLSRTGLIPDRLSLEVTEGLLLDRSSDVLEMMQGLRALGVRLSLDDFGTAHAGLSYLRCFPFDTIKIDASFIQDAGTRPEARAIVNTLLEMAKVLKLDAIAEGVETDDQFLMLLDMKCTQVQGFFAGRPMPASDIGGHAKSWGACASALVRPGSLAARRLG